MFLNGSLIFGALGGSAENTDVIVGEAFEDALKSDVRADIGLCTTSLLQLVTETLYKSGVLDRLLEVQKLDSLDIEGAIHAYYDVISEPCVVCGQLNEAEELHRYSSLHSLPLDQSLKIVKNFLIAATAKDCSLMISFRRRVCEEWGSSNNTIRLESGKFFDYKVHVIHFFSFCSFHRDARLFESILYYNFSKRNLRYIYEEQKELAFRNS